jgi:hypothetical protein
MKAKGHPDTQIDHSHGLSEKILGVKNDNLGRIALGVVAIAHDPTVILVGVVAPGHENRLLVLL